jgi:hydrogenase expression/formation protein HypE
MWDVSSPRPWADVDPPGSPPNEDLLQAACPIPMTEPGTVTLAHGSGGKLTADLVRDVFLPAFRNPLLEKLDDQAVFAVGGARLAFTTDSFVVSPLEFPGGDIGKLAVNGTINDLAMSGAAPLYLSVAFILEEGLPLETLQRVVASMRQAASGAGVSIVTGDTKVVERGHGDGMFVTTTGVGIVPDGIEVSADRARPSDRVLVSGYIAQHGMAIMARREGLDFDVPLESDTAALHGLVQAMLAVTPDVHVLRDPTRGGLASALNEIAERSGVAILLDEESLPLQPEVEGLCEMLGLDPLYVANEGKLVAIVPAAHAEAVLAAMRAHPHGAHAAIVGEVEADPAGLVYLRTCVGGTRIVDMPAGEQLPRIC